MINQRTHESEKETENEGKRKLLGDESCNI